MKLSDLIPEAHSLPAGHQSIQINGISDHTDRIKKGDLFICKKGKRFDPAYLIPLVERKGAVAVLAEAGTALPSVEIPCVYVDSIRETEAAVWRRFCGYPEQGMSLVGITGTNGKTSTAMILSHMLTNSGISCGYIGTLGVMLNGHPLHRFPIDGMTTPPPSLLYPVLRHFKEQGARAVVMEVSSHGLAQTRVHGLLFDYALFTNLTEDHLDYHGTFDSYFEAKKKLFDQSNHAVINLDDPYGKRLFEQVSCEKTGIGVLENTSYHVEDLYETPEEGTKYTCVTPVSSFDVSYPLQGAFNVYNTLLAITAALLLGLCPDQVKQALLRLPSIPGRMERLALDTPFSVIIDYAHTPDAMEQALKTARKNTRGKVFALFGAGGDREKEKRAIMGRVAEKYADFCFVTSDNARTESARSILSDILSGMPNKEKRRVISDRRLAIVTALSCLKDGDTLVLLGKGHENYLITKDGKQPFSEKDIVYSYVMEHKDLWS